MKKFILTLIAATFLTLGVATASETAPKSVIHVVTVKWKPDATKEQIKAALDGAQALPAAYKGITRVWTDSFKVQGGPKDGGDWSQVIVMEFADKAAFEKYSGSDAQKAWYKSYLPIRQVSNTHDITN